MRTEPLRNFSADRPVGTRSAQRTRCRFAPQNFSDENNIPFSTLIEPLTYPCTLDMWASLKERGMLSRQASIYAGTRKIDLIMVGLPMEGKIDEMVAQLGVALAD